LKDLEPRHYSAPMGKRWEEVCSSACHLQFEKNKNKIDEHPYSFSWHDGRKKKKISCYN
jgi:hypothetical protein